MRDFMIVVWKMLRMSWLPVTVLLGTWCVLLVCAAVDLHLFSSVSRPQESFAWFYSVSCELFAWLTAVVVAMAFSIWLGYSHDRSKIDWLPLSLQRQAIASLLATIVVYTVCSSILRLPHWLGYFGPRGEFGEYLTLPDLSAESAGVNYFLVHALITLVSAIVIISIFSLLFLRWIYSLLNFVYFVTTSYVLFQFQAFQFNRGSDQAEIAVILVTLALISVPLATNWLRWFGEAPRERYRPSSLAYGTIVLLTGFSLVFLFVRHGYDRGFSLLRYFASTHTSQELMQLDHVDIPDDSAILGNFRGDLFQLDSRGTLSQVYLNSGWVIPGIYDDATRLGYEDKLSAVVRDKQLRYWAIEQTSEYNKVRLVCIKNGVIIPIPGALFGVYSYQNLRTHENGVILDYQNREGATISTYYSDPDAPGIALGALGTFGNDEIGVLEAFETGKEEDMKWRWTVNGKEIACPRLANDVGARSVTGYRVGGQWVFEVAAHTTPDKTIKLEYCTAENRIILNIPSLEERHQILEGRLYVLNGNAIKIYERLNLPPVLLSLKSDPKSDEPVIRPWFIYRIQGARLWAVAREWNKFLTIDIKTGQVNVWFTMNSKHKKTQAISVTNSGVFVEENRQWKFVDWEGNVSEFGYLFPTDKAH